MHIRSQSESLAEQHFFRSRFEQTRVLRFQILQQQVVIGNGIVRHFPNRRERIFNIPETGLQGIVIGSETVKITLVIIRFYQGCLRHTHRLSHDFQLAHGHRIPVSILIRHLQVHPGQGGIITVLVIKHFLRRDLRLWQHFQPITAGTA